MLLINTNKKKKKKLERKATKCKAGIFKYVLSSYKMNNNPVSILFITV